MANANNRFAGAKCFADLEDMFEYAVSPENLYADGERTPAEAQALYKRLQAHYAERDTELQQEHFGPMR